VDVIWRFLPSAEAGRFDERRCVLLALPNEPEIGFGLALAAGCLSYRWHGLLAGSDIAALLERPQVAEFGRAMRQALKISNEELVQMEGALLGAGMMLQKALRPAQYKRFAARSTAADSRRLLVALTALGQHTEAIREVLARLDALEGTVVAPEPLVTGDDLTAMGMAPGPAFKRILEEVYDAQLEERVKEKGEALEMARKLGGR
jgi:poly(A) polymerase